ncbi:MAG: Uma2 family endonuclease [Planctomycetaceae bacterium]|nr:Uma2 family endonuclease [Planctomycetaceae bacterium]
MPVARDVSYDLYDKLNVYRRNGVCEYLVWRKEDRAMDWFILTNGRFETLPVGDDGILRSTVLPGLWLDPAAVLRGDLRRALEVLNQGITDASHESFVEKLKSKKA